MDKNNDDSKIDVLKMVDLDPGLEIGSEERLRIWPSPTDEMMESTEFKAVWDCIKTWDINVPEVDGDMYSGATGNHVRAILEALGTSRLSWRRSYE